MYNPFDIFNDGHGFRDTWSRKPIQPKYTVAHHNFGTFFERQHDTFEAAVNFARSMGFEATIYCGRMVVGSWSPIGGTKQIGAVDGPRS